MASSVYAKTKVDGVTYSTHKLVWMLNNGAVPDGYVVHHIDHNKRNNDPSNLTLMTHAEHSQHHNQKYDRIKVCVVCDESFEPAAKHRGRQQTCSWACRNKLIGQKPKARKISPEQTAEIGRRRAAGERGSDLAREFGISQQQVCNIHKGRSACPGA